MADNTFPAEQKLRRQGDFQAVFAARNSAGGARLVVYGRPNGLAFGRVGLVVGRKFAGAVVRNRFKRLCREAFRLSRGEHPAGFDWLVLPKKGPKPIKGNHLDWRLEEIRRELLEGMRRVARRRPAP